MICYLLLLLLPFVFCVPIQQQQQQQQSSTSPSSSISQQSIATNQMILYDDIQGYYENILDEIISTQSEDLLVRLSNAKNDITKLESLLQPQATSLLSRPINHQCLERMPSMIAKQLHLIHSEMINHVEPYLQKVMPHYFDFNNNEKEENDASIHPDVLYTNLQLFNQEMTQRLLTLFNSQPLENIITQELTACELESNPKLKKFDFWSFLHGWFNNGFSLNTRSNDLPQRKVKMMAELNNKMIKKDQLIIVAGGKTKYQQQSYHYNDNDNNSPYNDIDEDDDFFVSGPTLLQSYLNIIVDSLTLEFDARLLDLYNTLRSDIWDDENAM